MADVGFEKGKQRPGRKIRKSREKHANKAASIAHRHGGGTATFEISEAAKAECTRSIQTRERYLKKYIDDTLLERVLSKAIGSLMKQPIFPKNPYRYLIPLIREKELDMQIDAKRAVVSKNVCLPASPEKGYVTQVKDHFNVYGIKQILETINVDIIGVLFNKLVKLTAVYMNYVKGSPESQSGQIEALTSIVGRCVFFGSMLPYISHLRLSHDIIVTTKKQADAIKSFTDQIIQNFEEFRAGGSGFTSGVYVVQRNRSGGAGIPKLWDQVAMRRNRGEFYRQVQEAVRSRQMIYMDVIVWMNLTPGKLVHGSGGVEIKLKRGRLSKVIGAHGIEEDFQSSGEDSDDDGMGGVDRHAHHGGFYKVRKEFSMYYFSKAGPGTKVQSFCRQPYSSLAMGVFMSQPAAVRYASLFGSPQTSEKTAETLKSDLSRDLSDHYQDGNWVQMYEVLLMVANLSGISVGAQVAQVLKSICGQLRQLSIESEVLATVLDKIQHHHGVSQTLLEMMEENLKTEFKSFYKQNAAMVGGRGLGRSSTFASLKLPIRSLLESTLDVKSRNLIFSDTTARHLLQMSRLYRVGELSLAADADKLFTKVSIFVEKTISGATGGKQKPSKIDVPSPPVLDVAKETNRVIKSNRFPSKVAREAVVLQYFCDSHLDLTMKEIYQSLLLDPMYPNPFPHITKIMQAAWARNELWVQSDDSIEEELFLTPSTPLPRINTKYPSCYVEKAGLKDDEVIYGSKCALAIADPSMLDKLYDHLPVLHNTTDASLHLKNNTEHVCVALARDTVIESRITAKSQGDLPSFLECHEHYAIEGAVKRSAIRLFVEHIMSYVNDFQAKTPHIVRALGVGDCGDECMRTMRSSGLNFDTSALSKNVATVRRELLKAAGEQKGIAMHAFVKLGVPYSPDTWMYLRKWFILHWRNPNSEVIEFHSYNIPAAVYEEAYFDQTYAEIAMEAQLDPNNFGLGFEDPANHESRMYRTYAMATRTEVARCWKVGNLLGAYHALIPYALVHPDDEELMIDIVRMLRSPAQSIYHLQVENVVLQHLLSSFSSSDPDNSCKGKVTSVGIKRQLVSHRHEVLTVIEKIGDVFVADGKTEINSKLSQVERIVGSSDVTKIKEGIVMLQNCHAYMAGVAACIGDAVHSNCAHINEVIKKCIDEYEQMFHFQDKQSDFKLDVDHMESQIDKYDEEGDD